VVVVVFLLGHFFGGFDEPMEKFDKTRTRRPSLPPPDPSSLLLLPFSGSTSFSFGVPGADESRKTTPVSSSSPRCTCSGEMEKLQNMVKEQKSMMDQMAQKLQSFEEQMKAKEIGMQSLRDSVQQLQLICEKMQSQLLGGRK